MTREHFTVAISIKVDGGNGRRLDFEADMEAIDESAAVIGAIEAVAEKMRQTQTQAQVAKADEE